jgi:hypothetical protein
MRNQSIILSSLLIFLASSFAENPPKEKVGAADPTEKVEVIAPPTGALMLKPEAALLEVGCAERTKLAGLVKVYKVCSRSPDGQLKDWEKRIETRSAPFMISLDFTYNVGGKRASDSFNEALVKAPILQTEAAKTEQVSFLSYVTALNIKKKTRMELHFASSKAEVPLVEIMFFEGDEEAKKFSVNDVGFAKNLAGIWLGQHTVDEKIRAALSK